MEEKYKYYCYFYTDGTKTPLFVGAAVYSSCFSKVIRINTFASIFTAELYGVMMALDYIIHNKTRKAIIFVDSQSVVKAVCSVVSTKNKLTLSVRVKVQQCLRDGQDIRLYRL